MKVEEQLISLYNEINNIAWSGSLPPVLVELVFAKVNKGWRTKFLENRNYKIVINIDAISCEERELYVNMMHQMVHIYNDLRDLKDTTNRYRYHNLVYKKEAENRGIIIQQRENDGYYPVDIEQDIYKQIRKVFSYKSYIQAVKDRGYYTDSKDGLERVYAKCPLCRKVIRMTRGTQVICALCQRLFVTMD